MLQWLLTIIVSCNLIGQSVVFKSHRSVHDLYVQRPCSFGIKIGCSNVKVKKIAFAPVPFLLWILYLVIMPILFPNDNANPAE